MTDDDQYSSYETPGGARDLDLLARVREDVRPPDAAVLAAARARLLDQDVAPAVLVRPLRRRRRTAQPVRWRVAASLAAAAVVAGGAYALTTDDPATGPAPRAGSTSGAGSTSPTIRFVNASQVLDAAAANAVRSEQSPAAGQYRHVRTHSYDVTTIEQPPDDGAYEFTENVADSWTPATGVSYRRVVNDISVDYPTAKQRAYAAAGPGGIPTRSVSWYEISAKGIETQIYPTRGSLGLCTGPSCPAVDSSVWEDPDGADLDSVPRDVTALRTSLYAHATANHRDLVKYGKGDQATVDDLAYQGLTTVITSTEVPGDLRAALYRVAKTIPGIKLIGSLANYDGTTGIAVGRVDSFHVEHDLIFTSSGSTYLGDRTIARASSDEFDVPAGTLLGATAVTVDVTGKPDLPR